MGTWVPRQGRWVDVAPAGLRVSGHDSPHVFTPILPATADHACDARERDRGCESCPTILCAVVPSRSHPPIERAAGNTEYRFEVIEAFASG